MGGQHAIGRGHTEGCSRLQSKARQGASQTIIRIVKPYAALSSRPLRPTQRAAYSARCRSSSFRADADHRSGVMAIRIPGSCRPLSCGPRNCDRHRAEYAPTVHAPRFRRRQCVHAAFERREPRPALSTTATACSLCRRPSREPTPGFRWRLVPSNSSRSHSGALRSPRPPQKSCSRSTDC